MSHTSDVGQFVDPVAPDPRAVVVDLFGGPGGWSTGLAAAGLADIGVEWDAAACRTRVAAGHATVHADVTVLDPAMFGPVWGLVMSPPCTAWSLAGKQGGRPDAFLDALAGRYDPSVYAAELETQRQVAAEWTAAWTAVAGDRGWLDDKGRLTPAGVDARDEEFGPEPAVEDERGALMAETVRWVTATRPVWIACEQVPPVLPMWRLLAQWLRERGYSAWAGILNAADYGVPQTRERAILIARRDGQAALPPVPTHSKDAGGVVDLFGEEREPWVSMGDALGWIATGNDPFVEYRRGGERIHEGFNPLSNPSDCVTSRVNRWQPRDVARQVRLVNNTSANAAVRGLNEPAPTMFFGARTNTVTWRWDEDDQVPDELAERYADPACRALEGSTGPNLGPDTKIVRITVDEAGVLQSFPAGYPWQGTGSERFLQVGDAVPPRLAEHVVKAVTNGLPVPVGASLGDGRAATVAAETMSVLTNPSADGVTVPDENRSADTPSADPIGFHALQTPISSEKVFPAVGTGNGEGWATSGLFMPAGADEPGRSAHQPDTADAEDVPDYIPHDTRMTAVSLFAGVGGFDLGVAQQGVRTVAVVEIDDNARGVLALRFPDAALLTDVREVTGEQLIEAGFDPDNGIIMGGFPCFPAGTLITTDHGPVPIEKVAVGDVVLTHERRWRPVVQTMSRDDAPLWRVQVMGAPPVLTTDEHPFYVRRSRDAEPEWVPASELARGMLVALSAADSSPAAPEQRLSAYLIGRWLGDGWTVTHTRTSTTPQGNRGSRVNSEANRVHWCCAHGERPEMEAAFRAAGLSPTVVEERTVTKFVMQSAAVARFLAEFGKLAHGKFLPEWVHGMPVEWQAELWRGWFDADGDTKETGAQNGTSVSRALILGMARVARTVFGRVAPIHPCGEGGETVIEGRTVTTRPCWNVRVNGGVPKQAFVDDDGTGWAPVRSSEPDGTRDTVFNIGVAEDESYVAEGLVVHNCQDLSTAGQRRGLAGERSGLFWEIPRLANETNAAWLLGENVPGLLSSEDGKDFLTVMDAFVNAGYLPDVELVDAQFFGVPQRRRRLYFLAHRADLALSCATKDSCLVALRLWVEAFHASVVAYRDGAWDGYVRPSRAIPAWMSAEGVTQRAVLIEKAGRSGWVDLVGAALDGLGETDFAGDMDPWVAGVDAGDVDDDAVAAGAVLLLAAGRAVAENGWAGPSWFASADAVAAAIEEVQEYAGQAGGSLFGGLDGVHDWDAWRSEADDVLHAVQRAAASGGGAGQVSAVAAGGGRDPHSGASPEPGAAGAAAVSVGAGGRGVSSRPDSGDVGDGFGDGAGRTGGGHAVPVSGEPWPIQDGQAMAKAQNGLGVGDAGAPAYTLDTRGLQAVGQPVPADAPPSVEDSRAWGISSDAVDRSGEGAAGDAASRAGMGVTEELSPALRARHPNAVAVAFNQRDEARMSDVGYTLQAQPGSDENLVMQPGDDDSEDVQVPFRKSRRAANPNDDETWVPADRSNTVNTFDIGDKRATELIVTGRWCTCKRLRDDEWTEDGRHAKCGLPTQGGSEGVVPLDLRSTGKTNDYGGAGTSGDGIGQPGDPTSTLGASSITPGVCQPVAFTTKDHGQDSGDVSPTLRAMGHTDSHANGGGQVGVVIPADQPGTIGVDEEGREYEVGPDGERLFSSAAQFGMWKESAPGAHDTVNASDYKRPEHHMVVRPEVEPTAVVRRLTPVETERLQGFPDGWTELKVDGKSGDVVAQSDAPRYKQMGNAVAVPCPAWVAGRVVAAHAGLRHPEVDGPGWPGGADPVAHTTGVPESQTGEDDPDGSDEVGDESEDES